MAPSKVTPVPCDRKEDDECGRDDDRPRVELRSYQLTDAAGNTSSLVLKVHVTRSQIQANIVSIQYDSAAPVRFGLNAERFEWALWEHGSLTNLDQQVRLGSGKDGQSAHAVFNAHENLTRIDAVAPRTPEVHVSMPGLVLLQTTTARGSLSLNFQPPAVDDHERPR